MSILVVGTVAFDTIETPFGRADHILGGSGTYISLAARYFGCPVGLVAVVGHDFPADYIQLLEDRGVGVEGLLKDGDGLTFSWKGRYHYDLNQRDTLATDLNVLQNFDPVVPEMYRSSRIICLGNLDPKIQLRVLDQVDNPELVICDTMNFWIENTPEDLQNLLRRVDVLVINDSEARELSEEPNLIRAARKIRNMGPEILIIKKGEHGALLFMDDVVFSAPAYPLEDIFDPTGAGDTFAGGFCGCIAACDAKDPVTLKNAIIYGSALASFTVEQFGTERLLSVTPEEVSSRVQAFHELSKIPEFTIPVMETV